MGNQCSASDICNIQTKREVSSMIKPHIPGLGNEIQTIEQFYSLINYISQKKWVFRPDSLICPEKFFSNYKEYLRDQTFVSEIWSNADIPDTTPVRSQSQPLMPQLKLLIRTGIPLDKSRDIILEIFKKTMSSNDIEYDCALKVAFAGNTPETFKNVPLFSYSNQIEDILPLHFLNDKGLEAFKRIMWIYEKNVPMLEYSPLLSQVVALLLLLLREDETYCVVKEMLEHSEKLLDKHQTIDGLKSLRWHLTFSGEQFDIFLESLTSFLEERQNGLVRLLRHFKTIKYDCNDLFWQLLKTLFLGYLPLSTVLKIFMAYLNEGIKIYCRFALAILKIFEKDLIQCNDPQDILLVIKEKSINISKLELQSLVTTAYSLSLGQLKRRLPTIQPQTFHAPETSKVYYPQLTERSSTTTTPHFETIWEWLSNRFKLTNPTLAYCSKTHGWSLMTLYSKCSENMNYKGLLLLVKTVDNVTFGAFIDGVAQTRRNQVAKTSIGTDESFVFQLEPNENKYKSSKKNSIHMICDRDFISIGAGAEGPAIYMSNDLLYGYSYRSETYENEPLNQTKDIHDSYFECSAVEVYWLD